MLHNMLWGLQKWHDFTTLFLREDSMKPTELREIVAEELEKRGLNQTDLAQMLGGKPGFIHMMAAQRFLSKLLRGGFT